MWPFNRNNTDWSTFLHSLETPLYIYLIIRQNLRNWRQVSDFTLTEVFGTDIQIIFVTTLIAYNNM